MTRKSIQQRIAELEVRKKTLEARLGKQERVLDTRRKILLGAFLLHRLTNGRDAFSKSLPEVLQRDLPGFLTRDIDKALFAELMSAATPASLQPSPPTSDDQTTPNGDSR